MGGSPGDTEMAEGKGVAGKDDWCECSGFERFDKVGKQPDVRLSLLCLRTVPEIPEKDISVLGLVTRAVSQLIQRA